MKQAHIVIDNHTGKILGVFANKESAEESMDVTCSKAPEKRDEMMRVETWPLLYSADHL